MKIFACVKQVPDVADIKFDPATRAIVRKGVQSVMNPFDRGLVTLSLELKQKFQAHTTIVTMGPPQAHDMVAECVAAGLDRAIHLCDPALAGSDTLATARALAAVIRKEGGGDLVLCGKYTVDGETAQVGPELAELLGLPHISGVERIEFSADGQTLTAERESDEGIEVLQAPLPCLITASEGLRPVTPMRRRPEGAPQPPVETCTAADLGLSPEQVGVAGSPTWVAEIRHLEPVPRPPVQMLSGTLEERAATLARVLLSDLHGAQRQEVPQVPPQRLEVPLGEKAVWVVTERMRGGAMAGGTRELLGQAAVLASQLGGEAVAVILGASPDEAARLPTECAACGADAVLLVDHPGLLPYGNEVHSAALSLAIEQRRPYVVLFSSTERGRDFAPRVAARLQLGLTGDAIGLHLNDAGRLVQLKPAFGGNIVAPILSRTDPQMATVRPGVFPLLLANPARRARTEVLALPDLPRGRTLLLRDEVKVDERAARLAGARIVVGVGMGIGDPGKLPLCEALCDVLGGALCATRRVTDKGWLPRQVQVGLTGKVIAPEIYIAVGIRGAPNHTIGIKRAGTIITINQDEKAPMFQLSSYGVVAECGAFLPALTAALRSAILLHP